MSATRQSTSRAQQSGKLKIGDDWNAIRIIALSQSNPLKAVAEFVENSIDAGASNVVITRGREKGEQYLLVADDGAGVPKDPQGLPNFRYVATHICDSIKQRLKQEGAQGIQGEFGIGLLSFWTVGENLSMTCSSDDGDAYTMHMRKGDPGYSVQKRRLMFAREGTELKIHPLLPGLKQLHGEKLQWYLASELRERIRQAKVNVRIVDRVARKEFTVEPRRFTGRLLHHLPTPVTSFGDVYVELYLNEPDPAHNVGLYRHGTRVVENIASLMDLDRSPWNAGMLQGILDASFLNLTPASRSGVLHDERFSAFVRALEPLEERLNQLIEAQKRAEQERASRNMLRTIRKAFREALLALPSEEYDWFDVLQRSASGRSTAQEYTGLAVTESDEEDIAQKTDTQQRAFYDFPGPLYSVRVSPASCVLPVRQSRNFHAVCRDRNRRTVNEDLTFQWAITEGGGRLENTEGEIVTYVAPAEPGLTRLQVNVRQGDTQCQAEALITVTDSLIQESRHQATDRQGLPGYSFERAPGELWRSRYDADQNVIIINNGHRDFVFASRTKAMKLRYIARLYAKELVLKNFPGQPAPELLERLIELSLYTEEHLK